MRSNREYDYFGNVLEYEYDYFASYSSTSTSTPKVLVLEYEYEYTSTITPSLIFANNCDCDVSNPRRTGVVCMDRDNDVVSDYFCSPRL